MSRNIIRFSGFSIGVPKGWTDVSESVGVDNCPFSVADAQNGVGVVQFSPAIYKSGQKPSPSIDDLASMVSEFGHEKGLGEPFDVITFTGSVSGASASFHSGDDLVRVWYVTDLASICLVTYVCDWGSRQVEAHLIEPIVKSIRFEAF